MKSIVCLLFTTVVGFAGTITPGGGTIAGGGTSTGGGTSLQQTTNIAASVVNNYNTTNTVSTAGNWIFINNGTTVVVSNQQSGAVLDLPATLFAALTNNYPSPVTLQTNLTVGGNLTVTGAVSAANTVLLSTIVTNGQDNVVLGTIISTNAAGTRAILTTATTSFSLQIQGAGGIGGIVVRTNGAIIFSGNPAATLSNGVLFASVTGNGAGLTNLILGPLAPGNVPMAFGDGTRRLTNSVITVTNGNVGIGTTTPGKTLDVAGTGLRVSTGVGSQSILLIKSSTYSSESSAGIAIDDGTSDTGLLFGTDVGNHISYIQSLDPGTSYSTRNLVLNAMGGNVGIGTTNPATALQVNGTVTASGFVIMSNAVPLAVVNGAVHWNSNNISEWVITPGKTNWLYNY